MKQNTLYKEVEKVERLMNNSYKGFQSGYEVRFSSGGEEYIFRTEDGIRGIDVPVTIEFNSFGAFMVIVDR